MLQIGLYDVTSASSVFKFYFISAAAIFALNVVMLYLTFIRFSRAFQINQRQLAVLCVCVGL